MQLGALALAGAATGLLGAVLGIGGGVFLVPALVLFFGVGMTQAAGAGLIAVIATSSAAASVNVDKGLVNMRLGVVLETATVLGALVGGLGAAYAPERALIALFGLILAVVSWLLWRASVEDPAVEAAAADCGTLGGQYYDPASDRTVSYAVHRLPIGMTVSLVAGGLSGLLGIGGGVLKVPALHLYCGMPMKAAAATSNFMIGVTASAGAIVYLERGGLDPVLSGAVALGALLGSRLGAALSFRLKGESIRRSFSIATMLLCALMLRRALYG